jgi:hypothetical protein
MDWFDLVQERDGWWSLVGGYELFGSIKCGEPVSFSRRTLPHAESKQVSSPVGSC